MTERLNNKALYGAYTQGMTGGEWELQVWQEDRPSATQHKGREGNDQGVPETKNSTD